MRRSARIDCSQVATLVLIAAEKWKITRGPCWMRRSARIDCSQVATLVLQKAGPLKRETDSRRDVPFCSALAERWAKRKKTSEMALVRQISCKSWN